MATYFILQENNQSAAYAFKVLQSGYKPEPRKNQREQYTVTGKLDVQVGPNEPLWHYTVKLYGKDTSTFSVTPGSIMTATTVKWANQDNLITLFGRDTPPANKFRFRDFDGKEYYVFFTGTMRPKPVTGEVTGDNAYLHFEISLRGSTS